MPKLLLLLICLAVILIPAVIIYKTQDTDQYKPGLWPEADTAVNQARHFYEIKKSAGDDFRDAPCLSNNLMDNWVADIVHSPRASADNLAGNQCPAYLSGKAEHFVELDIYGNIVRVK